MAYDLLTKRQTATDWSMGGYGYPGQQQWGGRRRHRRHRHQRPGMQPGQPGQPWSGTPGAPPPVVPPQGYPYMQYPYAPQPQPQAATPAGPQPQPTIDVFVGRALRAGVPMHNVQKALVKQGYDPRQISAIIGCARRR